MFARGLSFHLLLMTISICTSPTSSINVIDSSVPSSKFFIEILVNYVESVSTEIAAPKEDKDDSTKEMDGKKTKKVEKIPTEKQIKRQEMKEKRKKAKEEKRKMRELSKKFKVSLRG